MMSIPRVTSSLSSFSQPCPASGEPIPKVDSLMVLFCPFSPHFPAIYNYEAVQDVELSLQVGDTVHILEMYEGRCSSQGLWNKMRTNQDYFSNFWSIFSTSVTPQSTNLVCSGCCSLFNFKNRVKMQKCRGFLISVLFQAEFIKVRFHPSISKQH